MSLRVLSVLSLLALVALPTSAFFWPCPTAQADNTVPITPTDAVQMFLKIFPANLYLKSGSGDDDRYSCMSLYLLDEPDLTPCGCEPYNFTIDYYDQEGRTRTYGNFTIDSSSLPIKVLFTGLPGDMFGADNQKKILTLVSVGEKYAILQSCQSHFLNFAHNNYAYMFTPMSLDMSPVKWQCMAAEFTELTGLSKVHPGGICSSNSAA